MSKFWDFISSKQDSELLQVSSLRPTLFIGLGGFGSSVVRNVKTQIEETLEEYVDGFAFIGMDTHPKPINDSLSQLEYVPLSLGVHPDTMAKLYPKSLGSYRKLAGKWRARNITTGADKAKAVGRLAFVNPNTLRDFLDKLDDAQRKLLSFREHFNSALPIKIYIISTLAGGTGAGCLLDVYAVVREFFVNQGMYDIKIQSVIVTPEALEKTAPGTDLPDFYANTYATLKEINHFMSGREEIIDYDVEILGSVRINQEHIPNPIYLITNQNEYGTNIVSTIEDLRDIVISYLLYEIKTPMEDASGQPKPQDKENNDWGDAGVHGLNKAFSSMGVVQVGLPYNEVKELFSLSILHKAIQNEFIQEDIINQIDSWIMKNYLAEAGSDQLQEQIRKDADGNALRIKFDIEGEMEDVPRKKLGKTSQQIWQQKKEVVADSIRNIVQENSARILNRCLKSLDQEFLLSLNQNSINQAINFLDSAKVRIKYHNGSLLQELNEGKEKLEKIEQEVSSAIGNVINAAQSGWIGRKHKVEASISALGATIEIALNQQLVVWSMEESKDVYDQLLTYLEKKTDQWLKVIESLNGRLNFIELKRNQLLGKLNRLADINRRGAGNRFSLVDTDRLDVIYNKYIGSNEREIAARVNREFRQKNILNDTISEDREWINNSLSIFESEIDNRLEGFDILKLIDMFYPDDDDKRVLFTNLSKLGSPLFPLNANRKEPAYPIYRIVAVHPDLKKDFVDGLCAKYLTGEGLQHAFYETPYEVIIYSIQHGYSLWSLKRLDVYYAYYNREEENYERAVSKGLAQRPIHGWLHGLYCEEIFPKGSEEDEAMKWFIIGRALSRLYPTTITKDGHVDDKRNKAFIFNRGSYYYLVPAAGQKEIRLGQGLVDAYDAFEEHPEWQKHIQEIVESKIHSEGADSISGKLINEYRPIIESEIEEAGHDPERERLLRELLNSFDEFVKKELTQIRV